MGKTNKNNLFNVKKNGWKNIDEFESSRIENFCTHYKSFLNESKTERETINNARLIAENNGFK